MPPTLPALDPIPLPAPVWLLSDLLLLTFALHVVPMTMTLGGGFWAIVAAARSGQPDFADLARRLAKGLPYWTAATVTTGVAALLFLQVLYGPVFYAASVVIAWPWLSIVGLVLAAYYGYYFRAYRLEKNPRAAAWVGALAWLAFAAVAFVFVSQMTLMLHPDRLQAMYLADRSGATMSLAEPTLGSRYLHMVGGAIAIGAAWVAWVGSRTGDGNGQRITRFGSRAFAIAMVVEAAIGFWFLAALPGHVARAFLGSEAIPTTLLSLSVAGTSLAAWVAWRAGGTPSPRRSLLSASGLAAVVVVLMVLMRDVVRRESLGAAGQFEAMRVVPQWPVIALFLVLLLVGIGTVVWMLLVAGRAGRPA